MILNTVNKNSAASYRYFAEQVENLQPEFFNYLRGRINKDKKIYLNSRSKSPYNPFTSIWNQLLLSLLERMKAFEYIQGEVNKVQKVKDKFKITFSTNSKSQETKKLITVNSLIQRYGQKSEFTTLFGNIIFNRLPNDKKFAHDFDKITFEKIFKTIENSYPDLIGEVEAIDSIHNWYERGKYKGNKNRRFSFGRKKNLTKEDATESSKKFIAFAESCENYDVILIEFQNKTFEPGFIEDFSEMTMKSWMPNYPRTILPSNMNGINEKALNSLKLIFLIPQDYAPSYLKLAEKHFKNFRLKAQQ